MRITACILPAAVMAAALALAAETAAAQSFLQNLFGFGGPSGGVSAPGPAPVVRTPLPPLSAGAPLSRPPSISPRRVTVDDVGQGETEREPHQPPGWTGKYRTLCVRACDGYYFPLSNSAGRARFMRDAAQCRASCGEEARLFYMPAGADNVATMIDLGGRAYMRHPNAFKYRKSLINGCSCRPMPWSEAEMARHRRYAEAEARRTEAHATLPAGVRLPHVAAGEVAAAAAEPAPLRAEQVAETGIETAVDETAAREHAAKAVAAPVQAAATRLQRTASPARAGAAPRPVRMDAKLSVSSGSAGGLFSGFGASQPKYTWPGDAPRR